MRIVYIAGPYRAKTPWDVEQNVRRAEGAGLAVARVGAMPLIPHTMTRFFDGQCTDSHWLEGTLELLTRSDGMLVLHGWQNSQGTRAEVDHARQLAMPIFTTIEQVQRWVAAGRVDVTDHTREQRSTLAIACGALHQSDECPADCKDTDCIYRWTQGRV